jgi:hypothetical protein
MLADVLDGKLGEVYQARMLHFPLSYAWGALACGAVRSSRTHILNKHRLFIAKYLGMLFASKLIKIEMGSARPPFLINIDVTNHSVDHTVRAWAVRLQLAVKREKQCQQLPKDDIQRRTIRVRNRQP